MFDYIVKLNDGTIASQNRATPYIIDYIPRGRQLVVSFESEGLLEHLRENEFREGPLQGAVLSVGYSILSIKAAEDDWYRNPACAAFFEGPDFARLASMHSQVLFVGSSMGAYAAAAYSRCLPRSILLAFSPQSTLDRNVVAWDERFPQAANLDWAGRYCDAAEPAKQMARRYVVFDPLNIHNKKHAERFQGGNVRFLRVPFAGHHVATLLSSLGILPRLIKDAMKDTVSFPSLIRDRRTAEIYQEQFMARATTEWRRDPMSRYLRAKGSPHPGS